MTILGIESSCDETAVSICRNGKILSNIVSSQEVHNNYGGVVPEVASREHDRLLNILVLESITEDEDGLVDKTLNSSDLFPGSFTKSLSPTETTSPFILESKILVSLMNKSDFEFAGLNTILFVDSNSTFLRTILSLIVD